MAISTSLGLLFLVAFGTLVAQRPGGFGGNQQGPNQFGQFGGGPQFPGPFRPPVIRPPQFARDFFVGTFLSNPERDAQTNMWKVFTAAGLSTELLNQNLTIEISREGSTVPQSYRFTETTVANGVNETLVDYVFQLGVQNSTVLNGNDATYMARVQGDDLLFVYNVTNVGVVRVELDFDSRHGGGFFGGRRGGLDAKYSYPSNIRGERRFGRRL